ncbi:beta-ketoacyl-[acyl-carrier-protein] synthase family protein [Paenibacillus aceris]|uniref:3-oxoacyl-[acyl-carrier-protein] synthase II n=1 Tax=Paenibacillus aceris TaxID=869555 RepID=A0ABS4I3W4_9BACL|nr:beta-ketoacyl-[acyl-carrier-protein] synthase family protein [Paenibacillus aceris]MBP1965611.1 3-oxoacyl-[acyl-carrier-protein] synthase II [Paenibacillus aceris]
MKLKPKNRVVVTGIGIICSLGADKSQVLAKMKKNETGIGSITRFHTDKFISRIGAEVKDYQPENFFSEEEQERYDYCSQFGIIAAKEAMAESGIAITNENAARFGVAFGTCNGGINSLEEQATVTELDVDRTSRYPFFQQGDNIAMYFGMQGPVNTLNTACAASGNAIGYAYDMITAGYADKMLAGGSDSMSSSVYAGFNVLQALNTVPCSPYNNKFGLSLGEGAAFVVLESLESALARNATIYSEICGYGLSSDAYHETAPEPEGKGIQLAVEFALNNAGISKDQIDYINTHGTGTKANDSAELYGLRQLFGEERFSQILISSSKAYFGHNLGAAASIEYVTTLLALQEGLLPATLHFETPRDDVNWANLVVNEMRESSVKYFLCNNSAFGGHNCSIVSYNWAEGGRIAEELHTQEPKRVAVVGLGTVSRFGHRSGSILPWLAEDGMAVTAAESSFSLKEYNKELYERRMNPLSQYSIGAAHLALQDADLSTSENSCEIGLFYGTSRGSLESAQKYLSAIFEKGPEHASGVYFPDMVLNSTAGKIAKKLGLRGYGTSMSTGGNDGLNSALYGYETIRAGVQKYSLIGAGDERSLFSTQVDTALGLDNIPYEIGEGSAFLVLMDLEQAKLEGKEVYAELKGFGTAFSGTKGGSDGSAVTRVIEMALARSGVEASSIDFVLFNSFIGMDEPSAEREALDELFSDNELSVVCLNDRFGYCESTGSLFHLSAAVDILHANKQISDTGLDVAAAAAFVSKGMKGNYGLVVSSSINGNYTAVVVAPGE